MDAPEHSWNEWAVALSPLPAGTIIDFSGGEPLLFNGMPELLLAIGQLGIKWGMTTNALHTDAVRRLCELHPAGCMAVNVSDHAGNARASQNIPLLRQHFPVYINRVSHPSAGHHESGGNELPFQDWENGALDGKTRECDAGANHWVADPNGDLWRCQVSMQLGHEPMGNIFTGEMKQVSPVCDFGCSTCYRDTPEPWCIKMREI